MNKEAILELIMTAISSEIKENWCDDLTDKERELVEDSLKYIIEEAVALALTHDENKKEFHRRNIEHYKSALSSIKAISSIKAYNSMINVIGRIIASLLIATGKSF